ncbi:hypothetical protein Nmel_018406 [Mimus melanotis]
MNNVPLHLWDQVPQHVARMDHQSALRQLSWEEPRAFLVFASQWQRPRADLARQEVLRMNNSCQSYRMREAATFPRRVWPRSAPRSEFSFSTFLACSSWVVAKFVVAPPACLPVLNNLGFLPLNPQVTHRILGFVYKQCTLQHVPHLKSGDWICRRLKDCGAGRAPLGGMPSSLTSAANYPSLC